MQIFNTLTRQKEEFVPQVPVNTASMSAALPFITISTSATPAR